MNTQSSGPVVQENVNLNKTEIIGYVICVVCSLAISAALFAFRDIFSLQHLVILLIVLTALVVPLIGFNRFLVVRENSDELRTIRRERAKIEKRLAGNQKSDVLATVELSLNQLNEYYTINKRQVQKAFGYSIVAIFVGWAAVLAGVVVYYVQMPNNLTVASISGISGIITQFIGFIYLYMYKKSIDQFNSLFHVLMRTQDTMLAVRLCQDIEPADKQAEVRERIIQTLLARSSSNIKVPRKSSGTKPSIKQNSPRKADQTSNVNINDSEDSA